MNVGDDGKKRPRTAFSAEQVRSLEQEFQRSKYLSVSKRTEMSRQLGLTEQQVTLDHCLIIILFMVIIKS